MNVIAPLGPVYQAGTLSGNPLAVAAGLMTLSLLNDALYEKLESLGARLEEGLKQGLKNAGLTGTVQRVGSMITLFFAEGPIRSWDDAKKSNTQQFAAFHHGLLSRGVYWPPSQYEAAFLSGAHTEGDIRATVEAAEAALKEAAAVGASA